MHSQEESIPELIQISECLLQVVDCQPEYQHLVSVIPVIAQMWALTLTEKTL